MTSDASSSIAPLEQKAEPIAPPLGDVTASGFKWTLALTIVCRFLSLAQSVLMAHLLVKGDNGAYVQAMIAVSLVASLRDSPLGSVLVSRGKDFFRYQSDAFWLSLGMGVVSGAIIAAIGWRAWEQPDGQIVAKLLWMNAIASPLMVAGTVSSTKVQIQMRFALNAKIATVSYLFTALLTVILAAPPFRLGAYALMVPQVLSGVGRAFYFLWLEPPKVEWRIGFRTIALLIFASSIMALSNFSGQVVGQGDNFVVARHFGRDIVGLYGWAFLLSVQALLILASSLGAVILPALSLLADEPARQMSGFLRMARMMAVIGTPFCVLQILFAQPIIKPIFSSEWSGAEPFVRILSFGMIFALVNGFATQLMLARRQNRLLVISSIGTIAVFIVLVYFGVWIGGVNGVAWGVVAYHAIISSILMRISLGKYGSFADIRRIFLTPLIAAAVAALPTLSMIWLLPTIYHGDGSLPATLAAVSLFATLFCVIYLLIIRTLAPEPWREVMQRLDVMTRRFGVNLV